MLRQFVLSVFFVFLFSSAHAQGRTNQHQVEWIFTGQDALAKYLELIREARSFIHISNIAFDDDPLVRTIADELCERSQNGVEVRMLIDSISQAPHPGPYGVIWLTKKMTTKLQRCGIELRLIPVLKPRPEESGLKGTKGRHHRKFFIVDDVGDTGQRVTKTIMGSRVFLQSYLRIKKQHFPATL